MDNKKKEKSEGEKLAEKLLSDKKNGGLRLSEEKIKKADKFCEGYKSFLNTAKTEREAVIEAVAQAEKAGFKPYEKGKKYDAGDKFYFVNRGKAIILTVMGKDGLEKGIRLAAAHIDSPRLEPTLRGQGTLPVQDTLLRRHKKISVDNCSNVTSWRCYKG